MVSAAGLAPDPVVPAARLARLLISDLYSTGNREVLAELGSLGSPAVEPVAAAIEHGQPAYRDDLAGVLQQVDPAGLAELCAGWLGTELHAEGERWLHRLGRHDLLWDYWRGQAYSADPEARRRATDPLATVSTGAAVLVDLLADPVEIVARCATAALGKARVLAPEHLAALKARYGGKLAAVDPLYRQIVVEAVGVHAGPADLPWFYQIARDDSSIWVRAAAIQAANEVEQRGG